MVWQPSVNFRSSTKVARLRRHSPTHRDVSCGMWHLIRQILQVIGAITLLVIVFTFTSFWFLSGWLQVEDRLERADYIVVLAGSSHRLMKAAELYAEGLAPKILLSNGYLRPPSRIQKLRWKMGYPKTDPRAFRLRLLAELGVPETATESFGDGHISTVEEAEALRKHLAGHHVRLIIVTSPAHTRRAKIIFEDAMTEANVQMAAPPEGRLSRHWWTDQTSAQIMVAEVAKLIYYLIGGRYQSNTGAP